MIAQSQQNYYAADLGFQPCSLMPRPTPSNLARTLHCHWRQATFLLYEVFILVGRHSVAKEDKCKHINKQDTFFLFFFFICSEFCHTLKWNVLEFSSKDIGEYEQNDMRGNDKTRILLAHLGAYDSRMVLFGLNCPTWRQTAGRRMLAWLLSCYGCTGSTPHYLQPAFFFCVLTCGISQHRVS